MLLHVSSTRAHRREAKIVPYKLWYHHTETSEWSKITRITKILSMFYFPRNTANFIILTFMFQ